MANTACPTAEAEKAYKAAEKCFILGDINGAIRWASPLSSSHRDLANALAAYEVHAAAALFPSRGENWHAVLGMDKLPASAITEDEIKKRYKRLCLVLHPDKNRSAAADGAFKLIRQAWEELSVPTRAEPDFWPRRSARAAEAGRSSRREASPDPGEKWWEWFGIPRDWWKEQETGSADDSSEQGASTSSRWRSWRLRYASRHGPVYCWHCNSGYVEEEDETQDEESGERCHSCGAPLKLRVEATDQSPETEEEGEVPPQEEAAPRPPSSPIFMEEDEEEEVPPPPPEEEEAAPPPPPEPIFMEEEVPPPRKKATPPPPSEPIFMEEDEEEEATPPTPPPPREAPPRRRNGRYFPCPGQCRRCGARFSSTVSVGTWHVSCTLCHLPAKLHGRMCVWL
ncbi:hypothetical protein EJB05_03425, partial [Eragrostis curvula]